jgi:predicted transglutaminase-like cysteine proteinase
MKRFSLRSAAGRVVLAAFGLACLSGAAFASQPQRKPLLRTSIEVAPQPTFFRIADHLAARRGDARLPETGPVTDQAQLEPAAALVEPVSLRVSLDVEAAPALFNTVAYTVPGGDLSQKWDDMLRRWSRDQAVISGCAEGPCRHAGAARWIEIRSAAAQREGTDRLAFVQTAINRAIAYATDYQINGAADYWASPLEAINRAGDCEDYAIAKYLMLAELGVPTASMRIVIIHETLSGQFHSVLAVEQGGTWQFLDNKHTRLTQERDYTATRPVATMDHNGQAMLIALPSRRFDVAIRPAIP